MLQTALHKDLKGCRTRKADKIRRGKDELYCKKGAQKEHTGAKKTAEISATSS